MSRFRPTRARLVVAAAVLGTAALLTGCAAGDSAAPPAAADPESPTAGVTLNAGQLGTATITEAMMEAAGELDDIDYTIEWSLFDGGPAFMEAVPSGQVDVANMADTPAIFAQVAGLPVHVVAAAKSSAADTSVVQIVAMPDSGIASVADLEGKKVAIFQGTTIQYTVAKALEDAGLSYDDIEPVNLPPADALTALQRGDIDAAGMLDPTLSVAMAGGAEPVGGGQGIITDWSITVATDAALADPGKEAAIEDFILRVDRAYEWSLANPEEWTAVYAETFGIDEALAGAIVARQGYDLIPLGDEFVESQQAQADTYYDLGLLEEQVDVSDELDDRFNDAVEAAQ